MSDEVPACEMTDERGSLDSGKGQKRSHVVLAEHVQGLEQDGSDHVVVAGSCMSHSVVKRSRLLSGLGATDGLAALPGETAPEAIKLWETSCNVSAELFPDELVTVLKVRDRAAAVFLYMLGPRSGPWLQCACTFL